VVREYAEPSFEAGAPLVDAVSALTERIHADFFYDPGFTTVTTPSTRLLQHRRGVCQDFATWLSGASGRWAWPPGT